MKKTLALILSVVLVLALLAGCGGSKKADAKTIKVAASPTPHAEILAVAKDILAEQGYDLEIIEYTDYVQPNMVVDSGEVDANYFQHTPYMDTFNEENGTSIVSAGLIHYVRPGVPVYLIDPKPVSAGSNVKQIMKGASEGMRELCEKYL